MSIYQIYLDSYFVLNFWMNLWVLFLCKKMIHSRVSLRKIMTVTFFATLLQCVILIFPGVGGYIKLILGYGLVSTLTLWYLFRPVDAGQLYRILLMAFMVAMVLGGSLQLAENFFFRDGISFLNLTGISGLCVLFLFRLLKEIRERKKERILRVRLFFSSRESCTLEALVDSGNSLIDPISKKPVSLVEKTVLREIREGLLPNRFRAIPFHSIGCQNGLLEAYGIERMEIEQAGEWKQIEAPLIGIVSGALSGKENYQMILHPALLDN